VSRQHQSQEKALIYHTGNNFFAKEGNKDCGALFLVNEGDFAGKVVLMLFYGKSMLHVGYVCRPGIDPNRLRSACSPLLDSHKGLRQSVFPEAWSYAEKLGKEGIMHLAKFENSPQKRILEQLLRAVWPGTIERA